MTTRRIGESFEDFRARRAEDRRRQRRMQVNRQSVLFDAAGGVRSQAVQYVPEREPYQAIDGAKLARRSSLIDSEGKVIQRWEIEKPGEAEREQLFKELIAGLKDDLPRAPALAMDAPYCPDGRLTVYPVGDHHFGMLSWKHETGASYDLDIGEKLLADAVDGLIEVTPAGGPALIAVLGDFFHYDGLEPVTPKSHHHLDVDSRYGKMVRVAVRAIRRMIAKALAHHSRVHVIVEIGNHDQSIAVFLAEALAIFYELDDRATVDTSPAHFHYYRFGSVLIGTFHGQGVDMGRLPLLMANDRPKDWGETLHRMWLTGHIHTRVAQDYPGCTVESFRILPPTEAYAAHAGYRTVRGMKALVIHPDFGEVARYSVNPQMWEPTK